MALSEGTQRAVATDVQVAYKVKDLGDVDPQLVAHYDANDERIEMTGGSLFHPRSLAVSPALSKTNLQLEVTFVPLDDYGIYSSLVWGSTSSFYNRIIVLFDADHRIKLRTWDSNNLLGEARLSSWSKLNTYRIKIQSGEEVVTAWVSTNGSGYQLIGEVPQVSFENQPVYFQNYSGSRVGAWDDLKISYPYVKLELSVNTKGQQDVLSAGVVPWEL